MLPYRRLKGGVHKAGIFFLRLNSLFQVKLKGKKLYNYFAIKSNFVFSKHL